MWVFTLVGAWFDQDHARNPALSREQLSSVLWTEYGIRGWLQAGVAAPFIARSTANAATGVEDDVAGLGDVNLYGKCRVLTERAIRPALALETFVKLPTGDEDDGLGNGETDVTIGLTLSKRRGAFSAHANPEYVFTGGNKAALGATADDRFAFNAGLMWHASATLIPMFEYNGFWWGDAGRQSDLGGGLLWFPTRNTSLKAGVAVPVHESGVAWTADWVPWIKIAAWF